MQKGLWESQECNGKCTKQQGSYTQKAGNSFCVMCKCVCPYVQDHSKIVPIWKKLSDKFGCALNSVVECHRFSLAIVLLFLFLNSLLGH